MTGCDIPHTNGHLKHQTKCQVSQRAITRGQVHPKAFKAKLSKLRSNIRGCRTNWSPRVLYFIKLIIIGSWLVAELTSNSLVFSGSIPRSSGNGLSQGTRMFSQRRRWFYQSLGKTGQNHEGNSLEVEDLIKGPIAALSNTVKTKHGTEWM